MSHAAIVSHLRTSNFTQIAQITQIFIVLFLSRNENIARSKLHREAFISNRECLKIHRDALRIHQDALKIHQDALKIHQDALKIQRDAYIFPFSAITISENI